MITISKDRNLELISSRADVRDHNFAVVGRIARAGWLFDPDGHKLQLLTSH